MIKLVTVSQSAEMNAEVRQIYESSFPEDERRDWMHLTDLINHPHFHFKLIFNGQSLIGIISIWKFDDFNFIEHFAIREEDRRKGFGTEVIQQIIASGKTILLELDIPISEMARKRILFYERLNFKVSDTDYFQPPYSIGKNKVQMLLMSYPETIDLPTLSGYKNLIYSQVYNFEI